MPPRPYRLGKRATSQAETRNKILTAAAVCFQRDGIRQTSMQAVAREAGVSPATVTTHFPDPDGLVTDVVDRLLADLRVPTSKIYHGTDHWPTKVRRLAVALATFYERSEPWVRMHFRERAEVPQLQRGERRFYGAISALLREALGPLGDDPDAMAVAGIVLSPGTLGPLRGPGRDAEGAGALAAALLVPWLQRRARAPQESSS